MIINKIRFYNNSNNLWLLYSPHSHDNTKETIMKWAKTSTQKDTKESLSLRRVPTASVVELASSFFVSIFLSYTCTDASSMGKGNMPQNQYNNCTKRNQTLAQDSPKV